jgi:uncharacterized protein GlcG (DUF336 family)
MFIHIRHSPFAIHYSPFSNLTGKGPAMPYFNLPRLTCFTSAARACLAAALGAVLGAALGTAPAGAALIMHKDLSLDVAKTIAETAIAACAAKGYPVSAVVVDRDGETIVAMHGDEAGLHTMENARRKAYTATAFKQPTADYAKKLQDPTSVVHQQVMLPNVIAIPGGQPIKIGNAVIGGVGVSGSPGVDDECINASLEKVKDELK